MSTASGSKQEMPLIQGACGGAEAADKEALYMLSGPARVKLYPAPSSAHKVNVKTVGS